MAGRFAGALGLWMVIAGCLADSGDYPPLPELCNGTDDDGDRRVDESVCPGARALCSGDTCQLECEPGRRDTDGQYSNGCECTLLNGGVETCDGRDQDCDARVDEDLPVRLTDRQQGVCLGARRICDAGGRWAEPVYADIRGFENVEVTCDGLDNDCDGRVDEASVERCNTLDDDCDGRVDEGVCDGAVVVCDGARCRLVCDAGRGDADRRHETGCECTLRNDGRERCDAVDDDCDGEVDESAGPAPLASRQQGVCGGALQVCSRGRWRDPESYSVIPGFEASEVSCDSLDNDCDGRSDEDTVADDLGAVCFAGRGRCRVEGQRICDPDDPSGPAICNALPADLARGEICNGEDDDCDGEVDEGLAFAEDCETGLPGQCLLGRRACVGGAVQCRPLRESSAERCNAVDDDCDGVVDEESGGTICPEFEDNAGSGTRACHEARCVIAACNPGRFDLDGGADGDPDGYRNGCETQCNPSPTGLDTCLGLDDCADDCDGQDDDCDGIADEQGPPHPLTPRPGVCAVPMVCDGGWREPVYEDEIARYEAVEAACDGLDNDCDGMTDEGLPDCCAEDEECPAWEPFCIAGHCRECDPVEQRGCDGGPSVCDAEDFTCRGCADDQECPDDAPMCRGGLCDDCHLDNHCQGRPAPFCVLGGCVGCKPSTHLGCADDELCCSDDGALRCVAANDARCTSCIGAVGACEANEFCEGRVCRSCEDDVDCAASGRELCVDGACRDCDPADGRGCPHARPICDAVQGTCRPCAANAECPAATPRCDGGRCSPCDGDADCEGRDGQFCSLGECGACNPQDHGGCDADALCCSQFGEVVCVPTSPERCRSCVLGACDRGDICVERACVPPDPNQRW